MGVSYIGRYASPLGEMLMAADEAGLIGLWFADQKYACRGLVGEEREEECPAFVQTRSWLDAYFSGEAPDELPPLRLKGTAFQTEIWEMLREIPYGGTVTYGELAGRYAKRHGRSRMSAQAVGGAVGRNPISILVPCHRVVGRKGALTGYAGGLERKASLLMLEEKNERERRVGAEKR